MLDALLAGKKIINKSDNFTDGRGLVVLRKLFYEGKPKFEEQTFVAEFQVISSEPSGEVDSAGNARKPNPPGAIVGYVQKPSGGSQAAQVAPGNMKMVVCALTGMTEAEADTEVETDAQRIENGKIITDKVKRLKWIANLDALRSKSQPGVGIVVAFETRRQATRDQKAKNIPRDQWYVFPRFEAVTQTPEQVEKFAKIIAEGKKVAPEDLLPTA